MQAIVLTISEEAMLLAKFSYFPRDEIRVGEVLNFTPNRQGMVRPLSGGDSVLIHALDRFGVKKSDSLSPDTVQGITKTPVVSGDKVFYVLNKNAPKPLASFWWKAHPST